jgi:hypothetical protein
MMQILDSISYWNSIQLPSTLESISPFAYEKELYRKAT